MKPVFVPCNMAHETPGSLESYLAEAGLEVVCMDLSRETPRNLPLGDAGALIVMGGPMSVHDVHQYPFLAAEIGWIREAVDRRLPLMGICLGSQLIAKAMGANVYPNGVKEIGWYPLQLLPLAAEDPLFAGCRATETVFQRHGDTFDLPDGAVLLARSEVCPQQAFRVGPCAWGLQFHIEMTPEMVDCWLSEPTNCRELAELAYIDPVAIRDATPHEILKMAPFAQRVLSRFAALCAGRPNSYGPPPDSATE